MRKREREKENHPSDSMMSRTKRKKRKGKVPHTPVQGSGAHEPLLSREATSHSLTAMLVWSCRLQSVDTKVLHVRSTRRSATVRGDHKTFLRGGGLERRKNSNIFSQEQTAEPINAGVFIHCRSPATTELTSMRNGN